MTSKILILMAYLNLSCRVVIGQVDLSNVNSFIIEESISEISAKSTIILPRNFQLLNGKKISDFINPGDRVYIQAGYLEHPTELEFAGYVREIGAEIPLEIISDQAFPFRGTNYVKAYRSVTLRQLLTDITNDLRSFDGSKFIIECPDVNLGKFSIDNASSYQVLADLKQNFGFYSRIYNNIIHVGFAWDWKPAFTKKHKYSIRENVKDTSQLKFKASRDFNTRVKVTINYPDGKRAFAEAGSKEKNAAVHSIPVGAKTKQEAEAIAKARLKQYTYDGYTGSITGFGIPRVHSGDTLEIIDKLLPERDGSYLVEKVTQRYSENGYERDCELSYKV